MSPSASLSLLCEQGCRLVSGVDSSGQTCIAFAQTQGCGLTQDEYFAFSSTRNETTFAVFSGSSMADGKGENNNKDAMSKVCSTWLIPFLQSLPSWKKGDYKHALQDGLIQFDKMMYSLSTCAKDTFQTNLGLETNGCGGAVVVVTDTHIYSARVGNFTPLIVCADKTVQGLKSNPSSSSSSLCSSVWNIFGAFSYKFPNQMLPLEQGYILLPDVCVVEKQPHHWLLLLETKGANTTTRWKNMVQNKTRCDPYFFGSVFKRLAKSRFQAQHSFRMRLKGVVSPSSPLFPSPKPYLSENKTQDLSAMDMKHLSFLELACKYLVLVKENKKREPSLPTNATGAVFQIHPHFGQSYYEEKRICMFGKLKEDLEHIRAISSKEERLGASRAFLGRFLRNNLNLKFLHIQNDEIFLNKYMYSLATSDMERPKEIASTYKTEKRHAYAETILPSIPPCNTTMLCRCGPEQQAPEGKQEPPPINHLFLLANAAAKAETNTSPAKEIFPPPQLKIQDDKICKQVFQPSSFPPLPMTSLLLSAAELSSSPSSPSSYSSSMSVNPSLVSSTVSSRIQEPMLGRRKERQEEEEEQEEQEKGGQKKKPRYQDKAQETQDESMRGKIDDNDNFIVSTAGKMAACLLIPDLSGLKDKRLARGVLFPIPASDFSYLCADFSLEKKAEKPACFNCPFCPKLCATPSSLQQHCTKMHNCFFKVPSQAYELIPCDICHKKFKNLQGLQIHQALTHRRILQQAENHQQEHYRDSLTSAENTNLYVDFTLPTRTTPTTTATTRLEEEEEEETPTKKPLLELPALPTTPPTTTTLPLPATTPSLPLPATSSTTLPATTPSLLLPATSSTTLPLPATTPPPSSSTQTTLSPPSPSTQSTTIHEQEKGANIPLPFVLDSTFQVCESSTQTSSSPHKDCLVLYNLPTPKFTNEPCSSIHSKESSTAADVSQATQDTCMANNQPGISSSSSSSSSSSTRTSTKPPSLSKGEAKSQKGRIHHVPSTYPATRSAAKRFESGYKLRSSTRRCKPKN